jgi:hypothetical protein
MPVRTSTNRVPYTERTAFSYSAKTVPGTTYPNGTVTTSDPVFLELVPDLDLRSTFSISTSASVALHGTIALTAKLVEPDGWSRVVVEGHPTHFSGHLGQATLTLPLNDAVDLARSSASETGIPDGQESLIVTSTVKVAGKVAGDRFVQTFAPQLPFIMNSLELSLLPGSTSGAGPMYPQLQSTRYGSLVNSTTSRVHFAVVGIRFNLQAARIGGVGASALMFGLVVTSALIFCRRRQGSEVERTLHRIERDVLPLDRDPSLTMEKIVDIGTITALTVLADRFDVEILTFIDGELHRYFAIVGDILYRCQVVVESKPLALKAENSPFLDACIIEGLMEQPWPRPQIVPNPQIVPRRVQPSKVG